jgi:uncharacterized protein YjbI with pentapeptide repeats
MTMIMISRLSVLAAVLLVGAVEGFGVPGFGIQQATKTTSQHNKDDFVTRMDVKAVFVSAALSVAVLAGGPLGALADGSTKEFKLPPIDKSDVNRCVLNGSKMGQANAARDKLYDLRQCNLSGADASGYVDYVNVYNVNVNYLMFAIRNIQ